MDVHVYKQINVPEDSKYHRISDTSLILYFILYFIIFDIGFHEWVPELEHGSKIANIMRVMEIMMLRPRFPRHKCQLPPTPIVPRMHLWPLYSPKHQPHTNTNIMHLHDPPQYQIPDSSRQYIPKNKLYRMCIGSRYRYSNCILMMLLMYGIQIAMECIMCPIECCILHE